VNIDPDLTYQCIQCGRSCTGWNVWLDRGLAEQLKELPITLRVIQDRGKAFEEQDGRLKMYRADDRDACGYLTQQKLCSIHSQLGYAAKPTPCRQFPFLVTRLPDGQLRVGASFCCSAVRGRLGPPLAESRDEIQALLDRDALIQQVQDPLESIPGQPWNWSQVQAFEEEVEARVSRHGWDLSLEQAMTALLTEWEAVPPKALPLILEVTSVSLLKPCLYDHDRELWQKIDRGFTGEVDLEIPEYLWQAPVTELQQRVANQVERRFDQDIDGYLRALWFRKAHLLTPSLLSGLLLLRSIPALLRILTVLEGHRSGRGSIGSDDFSRALDTVEMSLVAHSGNGSLVVQQMSHHLVVMAQS